MHEYTQIFTMFTDTFTPFRINYVGESFCDETFNFKRADYDAYSLEYILEGEGTLHINGRTYTPKKGDIFFLDKHSAHEYYSSRENPWHKLHVAFNGDLADAFVRNYLPGGEYVFDGEQLEAVFLRVNQIATDETLDFVTRHNRLVPELVNIFIGINTNCQTQQPDLAEEIKRCLDNSLQKPYTVNQLAKELNYTNNHIINVFVKKFGITPYQYYSQQKIRLAKEYLETTQLTVAEIAEQLCYLDARYFAICFKKATGTTPAKYRKQALEKNGM